MTRMRISKHSATLRRAASLLRSDARSIKEAHTLPPTFTDWAGANTEAHEDYRVRLVLAKGLAALADELETSDG